MIGIKVRVYNGGIHGEVVPPDSGFVEVSVRVKMWLPHRCPWCGQCASFDALANWVPVEVDGCGNVVRVQDETEIWPVLDETGPGLYCPVCRDWFDPVPTMYPRSSGEEEANDG